MEYEEGEELTREEFNERFKADLEIATSQVIIFGTFFSIWSIERWRPIIERAQRRDVQFCTYVQNPYKQKRVDPEYCETFERAKQLLLSMNCHVNVKVSDHQKAVIVDTGKRFYVGGYNFLGKSSQSEENMTLVANPRRCRDYMIKQGLDICTGCQLKGLDAPLDLDCLMKEFGEAVKIRRDQLGWTQEQLAKKVNTTRSIISRVENGKRNLTLESSFRLMHALDMELRGVPRFMLPSIDGQLGKF